MKRKLFVLFSNKDEKGDAVKVLVTGYKGQLGYDVIKVLDSLGIECRGADIEAFDLTSEEQVRSYIGSYAPDAVVHCAAYTAVDRAEDERELCSAVNVVGTRYIARACADIGAKLVYISTDYVFGGEGETPYEVESIPNPINYYGLTKYQGEETVKLIAERHFIIRTSWVFGINGNNFVKTMLRLGQERSELNVVADQIGSPTYTADLAVLICDMLQTEKYGTYHATNEGFCSWSQFASEIFALAGLNVKVNPVTTAQYPTKAIRPKNSRLSKKSLDNAGFARLPNWQDALGRYLKELP